MERRFPNKRPAVLIGLLAVLMAVLLAGQSFLFSQREKEGFSFAGLEGDASLLNRIRVTGILSDDCQRVAFATQGRNITHQTLRQTLTAEPRKDICSMTRFYEPLPGVEVERVFHEAGQTVKNSDGSVFPGDDEATFTETADQFRLCLRGTFCTDANAWLLQTQVTYHKKTTFLYRAMNGLKADVLQSDATINDQQELAQLGERWFTATITDGFCRGTGGIYEMTDVSGVSTSGKGDAPITERKNLYPIDLNGGKTEIVRLEACADQLALFVRVDGALTMRVIDPRTWETVQIIPLPGWEDLSGDETFIARDNMALLAGRQGTAAANDETAKQADGSVSWRAYVIDLERGAVVRKIEDVIPQADAAPYGDLFDACYDGETLYLLSYSHQERGGEGMESGAHAFLYVPYLIAYRGGQKALTCAIHSGEQEDWRANTEQLRQYSKLELQTGEGNQ